MNFFISDTHFGHFNILSYTNRGEQFQVSTDESVPLKNRQHRVVQEMNQFMIDSWNSVVTDNDTVYFDGDFSFLGTKQMKVILSQLKGKKILIKGNHDKSASQMKEIGFSEVHEYLEIKIGDFDVVLSHYPYVDIDLSDYAKLRPNIIKFTDNPNINNPDIPKHLNYDEGKEWLKTNLRKPVNSQKDGAKEYIQFLQRMISRYIGTRLTNEGKILVHGHTHNVRKRFANMINVSVEAWNFIPPNENQILELILEYQKEKNGDFISLENHKDFVYEYYAKLDNNIRPKGDFKKINELYQTFKQIDYAQVNNKPYKTLCVPQKYSKEWYDINIKYQGFIPKEKLKDMTFYKGTCRNADCALWDEKTNKFYYIRSKFGDEFIESIECPEDDVGYDVFIPHEEAQLSNTEIEEFYNLYTKRFKQEK